MRQDTAGDYIARSFSILLLAVPSFWVGTMVMVFPSIWWGWSPPVNFMHFLDDPWDNLKQMALPAVVLGMALSAITMRLTRTMMLEVLRQDYIRTAWAKGLPERLVVMRHALRNAMIPVITLVGLQAPLLIGGAVIIEQIFVIPGMGLLLLDAVNQRDYPIITGVFLAVGVAVMLINLVVDLSYGLLDPKVRYLRSTPLRTRGDSLTWPPSIPAIVAPDRPRRLAGPTASSAPLQARGFHRAPVPRQAARRRRRRDHAAVRADRRVRRAGSRPTASTRSRRSTA